MKITKNAVWNAEESETAHWNRYRRALKESSDAFKAWQKSTYRLRAAIRAGERNEMSERTDCLEHHTPGCLDSLCVARASNAALTASRKETTK